MIDFSDQETISDIGIAIGMIVVGTAIVLGVQYGQNYFFKTKKKRFG